MSIAERHGSHSSRPPRPCHGRPPVETRSLLLTTFIGGRPRPDSVEANTAHQVLVEAEERLLGLQVDRILALVRPTLDIEIAADRAVEILDQEREVRQARARYFQATVGAGSHGGS